MKARRKWLHRFSISVILILLLSGMPVTATPQAQNGSIVIDGVVDAAYGAPLASDAAGDGNGNANMDLLDLFVAEDADYFYFAFTINADITATDWGKYVIYVDTTNDANGAASDAWGRNVTVDDPHKPEFGLYSWVDSPPYGPDHTQLVAWTGAEWDWGNVGQVTAGAIGGGMPSVVEWQVARTDMGDPSEMWLEVWNTGGGGSDNTQDTINDPPEDWNATDWSTTAVLAVSTHYLPSPPPDWYVRGGFNDWGTTDRMYDDGTHGDVTADDGVYTALVTVATAGRYEFKVASEDWSTSYPLSNSWLDTTAANETVTITFDSNTYADGWLPETNIIGVSTEPGAWTAVGDWQGWNNADPATAMAALVSGVYEFTIPIASPGTHEYKAVKTGTWDAVGADGRSIDANTATFDTVEADQNVTFTVDALAGRVKVEVEPGSGLEPGDELLVTPPVRTDFTNNVFYFLLPDRFANGDSGNDTGGDTSSDPLVHGYLPTDKGYYHGGDLAGLMGQLDYLEDLGVTAIWMTPQFTNRWVQGDGTIGGSSAAYHGYWQIDYSQIDPHFGTNAEMQALIDAAHARGMKVFFDIVINHTGDVVSYEEGTFTYRSKEDYPYRDADGNVFDDRDYVGTSTFPPLDPATSFPYTPIFLTPEDAMAKSPAWLNDRIYYHNRGNSTFIGENSLYGDFFGLDDLFTEHPDVVNGMIDIHQNMITQFGIDGFRVDTVKHVNDELWQQFVPQILAHAEAQGNPDFFIFGEVFSGDASVLSRFTTELPFPSVLDFGFDSAAKQFASASAATDGLRDFFAADDYFTDADSNAHALVKFIGNHDIGRLGFDIDTSNPGAADAERVARSELSHALTFFSRGVPLIYYGDEQGFVGDGGDKDARQDMMPSQVASYNDDDLIGTAATTADDNFDPTHPLYQAYSQFASIRDAHPALRQGAQLHRYSQGTAGVYAFSRIERAERVEYVVAFNNSEGVASATFKTDSPDTTFTEVYPGGGSPLASDADGNLTVTVPGLDFVIYQASAPIPEGTSAPGILITTPEEGAEVIGRVEVRADLTTDAYAEVTFAVSVDGGDYQVLGTDDNAPYRMFYDVSSLPAGTALTFKAIVDDLAGHLNADKVSVVVGGEAPPPAGRQYAVIHYFRADGDYGDHTIIPFDYNNYWGLHLWEDIDEVIEWTAPKPFLGEDEYGRFAWVKLAEGATNVGFIVHRGDVKDGTTADRFFNPSLTPEIWLKNDDANTYTSQAEAQGFVTIHYHRPDGDYPDWGLHLWGDAIDPSEATAWDSPKPPTGLDDYGAFWNILIADASQAVNFIVHRGDDKDPGPDQSFMPLENATIWLQSGDETIYPQRGAAENYATLHYHRPGGDYGDYTSTDYRDFWGLHTWAGAVDPGWSTPRKPEAFDIFGAVFRVDLFDGADQIGYIFHRGDEKDPGPDQFLVFDTHGYEVWQLQGADPEDPYILPILGEPGANPGNIGEQRAYWVSEDTVAWAAADNGVDTYTLHYAPGGGLEATETGIIGGAFIALTRDPAGLSDEVKAKFPHLADLPALKIGADDLSLVPDILKSQIAVSAVDSEGLSVDATGLQIPGVLDDLYTYAGELGVSWDGGVPTIRVWAPTAKSVTFHLFDDSNPATTSTATPMTWDPATGVWSITGDASWKGKFYLFEIEVYVHSAGQVEHNLVTDPYSFSLAMNSTRSQIVDLNDTDLKPDGWDALGKPELAAPEDISIYEIHMRDFSVHDPSVPEEFKGTYKAFTLQDTYGVNHLKALAEAGLTHLHLLPVFDIATINENKTEWQAPDPAVLATYPPDSDQQQAAVTLYEDLDGFNWGYDPFHYTAPEGSYATDPDGPTRIVEFREMVQALNQMGLRVVMDVVYNHTNSQGQAEKSVLDRIVPGYYHRLNDRGQVETSTCCSNTASEHNMMEKLMVDSLVTWATQYKIDAFRFDLMGHHMVRNMLAVREALDALTLAEDGVDGKSVYMYGEGWNFGEVADNARGENATQLNLGGMGIGTFSDRLRDAVRGGGPFDGGQDLIGRQGFANGLYYDPNDLNSGSQQELDTLLLLADQIRVGMAGNLADYEFIDRNGNLVKGSDVDYNGQPAGYTEDPQEDITYISKHDNQTLYDNNTYKTPVPTSMMDRVRIQNVGLSTVLLGQGVPFMHAGSDLLRSKSLDRDSFNSGDWFNTLDFTYQSNNWGVGLPVAGKNQDNWPIMQPLLADPSLMPGPSDIRFSAALYQELLQIRYSSPLFRLRTAEDIQERVAFHNTGPDQIPGLIVMSLSDLVEPDLDFDHEMIVVLVNANDEAQTFTAADLVDFELSLHPVQADSVDDVVKTAGFDSATGTFTVPGRTTAVFVREATPQEKIGLLIVEVQGLVDSGALSERDGRHLTRHLESAIRALDRGHDHLAAVKLRVFVLQVKILVKRGRLAPEDGQRLKDTANAIIVQIDPRQ